MKILIFCFFFLFYRQNLKFGEFWKFLIRLNLIFYDFMKIFLPY